MLLGLLAAAIPFLLHLLSSIRAQEVFYPTLRFLKLSMEKTARRRHLQHWLLLIVRALMLGILALVVSEPFFKVGKNWAGASQAASVFIIDNSYSMATRDQAGIRLERARAQARAMLDDQTQRPAQAALLLTNSEGPGDVSNLTSDIERLRKAVDGVTLGYGKNVLVTRIHEAITRLADEFSTPEKTIYVFSDLHTEGFEDLLRATDSENVLKLAQDKGIHLLMVNVGQPNVVNVGVSDIQISGRRIADQPITFNVTVMNSSDENVRVHVDFRLHDDNDRPADRQTLTLQPRNREARLPYKETRQFRHTFTERGVYTGEVSISIANDSAGSNTLVDQLDVDDRRTFALEVGGRVRALIVRGHGGEDGSGLDGTTYLKPALDGLRNLGRPWSIVPEIIEASDVGPDALASTSMVLFNEVDRFSDEQAQAVIDFVSGGGTAVFFLGPECDVDHYNRVFFDDLKVTGPLLPGRIGTAQGDVGPGAQAEGAELIDQTSPFLAGLYPNAEDYKVMMVNRYYRVEDVIAPASTIMSLRSGPPLVAVRPFGKGLAVVCPTTASPRWSNFCSGGSPVFFSMLYRMALESPRQMQAEQMFLAYDEVPVETGPLRPDSERPETVTVALTAPDGKVTQIVAPLDPATGYTVKLPVELSRDKKIEANLPGLYTWTLEGAPEGLATRRSEGAFAVNLDGAESNLAAFDTEEFQTRCENRGFNNVFVGNTLEDVQARAAEASKGSPWWDKLIPLVILLLIAEALIANRRKLNESTIPKALNPAMPQST